jgi:hypothetical protein
LRLTDFVQSTDRSLMYGHELGFWCDPGSGEWGLCTHEDEEEMSGEG